MSTEPSKFAENQFESGTRNRNPMMGEMLDSTVPRITVAAVTTPALAPARDAVLDIAALWSDLEIANANARAGQLSATQSFADYMDSLTRKPDADNNSPLESWDAAIRSEVAYGGPTYTYLLPDGRETLTAGRYDDRIEALRGFSLRLAEQVAKPALVTLAATVAAWEMAATDLRAAQVQKIALAREAELAMEPARLAAAAELYAMVGLGMTLFKTQPEKVDTLFDVNVLRSASLPVPAAPADTAWDPAARLLSTTALPADATRLEAWRLGPGSVPELIALGARGETSVLIPASITFDAGDLYQLWLQARNGTGSSPAGPAVSWTA